MEENKKRQWAIVYKDENIIQCRGVYDDGYVALGKLILDMEEDMRGDKEEHFIVSDITLGVPLEADSGYLYFYHIKWEDTDEDNYHHMIENNRCYYLLEVGCK